MPLLLHCTRALALAALLSLTLTSCFDHGKKCDPKPSTTTPKGNTGGDN